MSFPALRPFLLLLLTAALPLRADIKTPQGAGKGPAMEDTSVNVVRGETVNIEIRGITGSNQAVAFEIVEQPKLGTLGKIQPQRLDRAIVPYTAPREGEGEIDRFIYTGKLPDSSAQRATVTIRLLKSAPRIEVHPVIGAGRVVLGSLVTKDFNLHNRGNAAWNVKLPAPKGWQWKTPAGGQFQLPAGGSIRCEMVFNGDSLGLKEETIVFDGEVKVNFTARVVPPFNVDVTEATLKWKPAASNRQGSVMLENYSSAPVKIAIAGPEWLQMPPEVDLQPDGKVPLTLVAGGPVGETLKGRVKLTAGKFSREIDVTVLPGPGVLVMTSSATNGDAYNFGLLTAETLKTAKHTVNVKNAGGAEIVLTVEPLKSFRFESPLPPEIKLAAGAEYSVTVLPPLTAAGTHLEELVFTTPGARLSLWLAAGVDPSSLQPDAGSEAIRQLVQQIQSGLVLPKALPVIHQQAVENTHGLVALDGTEDKSVPKVELVDVVEDLGHTIKIAWLAPPGADWKYRLEYPVTEHIKAERRFIKLWIPFEEEHVKMSTSGGVVTAEISNLVSGQALTFRIQTLGPDGKKSFPGKPISVHFRIQKEPWNWKPWAIGGVVVLWLGHRLWKYWKKPIRAV